MSFVPSLTTSRALETNAEVDFLAYIADNNTVYIPFDSVYEIIFKNLNSRDALVDISIDGQNVLDNGHIIVRANSSGLLEGFLKDNKVTNKFKFIRKTNQISNYRGDFIDDGIIRIEYKVRPDQADNYNL